MEDSYIITGGKKLEGEIRLSGAKNVALKVIIASLLFDQEIELHNIPKIGDVVELLHLIVELGGKANFTDTNTVVVDGRNLYKNKVDLLHASKIRVSFMLFAPLLKKFGKALVPNPGGCRIGARPIDRAVDGMRKLGIKVEYDSETGYYEASQNSESSDHYRFSKPSHTATELLMLHSLSGKKQTALENCAYEPEIDELVRFLVAGGAKIKREGAKIIINPQTKLKIETPFTIMPDRNEAVTFITLSCAVGGEITIYNTKNIYIDAFLKRLKTANAANIYQGDNFLTISPNGNLKAANIETAPHPGFMTDWQPNWAVLMTQAAGESHIIERVFENRFSYVSELKKLGAEIDFIKPPITNPTEYFFFNFDPNKKYNQAVRITGPQKLHGGVLEIADLRAGATLAIAAIMAEGESIVNGASIIERGYEDFVDKIRSLGADIKKV